MAHRGHHLRASATVTAAPGSRARCRSGTAIVQAARELGRAVGQFVRELRDTALDKALAKLRDHHALDDLAASNLLQYLDEQAEATGVVPDDRTVVVERFRDEIGDWRICILSPFGTPVHAPWAMAIERRLADHFGVPVESMWGDDGIVLRLPEAAEDLPIELISIEPDDIEDIVVSALPQTALFFAPANAPAVPAAAAPAPRPAHAAVATAPARRRPARCRRQVPDVPGAASRHRGSACRTCSPTSRR